jgi:hypothetical protein
MLRNFVQYFEEYYNQDALVLWFKTMVGVTVLNVPYYLPEVQGGAKLLSTILALGSGSIGFVLLCFKLWDELRKRFRK